MAGKSMSHKPAHRTGKVQQIPMRIIEWIIGLPRLTRILLVAAFALAVTLSISPLVDIIYADFFFSMDTRMAPSLVTAVFG